MKVFSSADAAVLQRRINKMYRNKKNVRSYSLQHCTVYKLQFALCTLHFEFPPKTNIVHSTLDSCRVVGCTLYTPCFPLDTPHTLHFTFYSLHSARYTFYIPHFSCTSMICSCQFHILTCCFSLVGPRLSGHRCWAPVCSAVFFFHLVIVYSNCITNGTFSHIVLPLCHGISKNKCLQRSKSGVIVQRMHC